MISARLRNQFGRFYSLVTGSPFTPRMENFLRHLSWVSIGYVVAKVLTIVANLIAGRLMGPAEYGLFSLALAVSSFVVIFIIWGMQTASIRFGTGQEPKVKSEAYNTGLTMFILLGGLGTAILLFLSGPLSIQLNIPSSVFVFGVAYSVAYCGYNFFVSLQQSEGEFQDRSLSEILFGVLSLALFGVIYALFLKDFRSLALAVTLGYVLAMLWAARHRSFPGLFRFSVPAARKMLPFGLWWMADSLGHSLQLFFLRFLVNDRLSSADVGVLSIYTMSSVILSFYFLIVFETVFFPAAVAHPDRATLWDRMVRLFKTACVPLFLFFLFTQATALVLVGKDYPFLPGYMVIFAVTSVIALFQAVLAWLLVSEGIHGYRRVVLIKYVSGAAMVALGLWWVPKFGLTGAVYTYAATYIVSLLLILPCKKLFRTTSNAS